MDVSFAPDGLWFVFDTETGKTIKRGLESRAAALGWIFRRMQAEKVEATVH